MTRIADLIPIPARVEKSDFVLRLTEGVQHPEATLRQYVVTPQLARCFDEALGYIKSALETRSSRATYLHGSFGSGKSHFMAILHLILEGNASAKGIDELAPVIVKHNPWVQGKKFLLVPYHMIGARNMESGVLGGYADFVRKMHPGAAVPAVYRAEGLFADARKLRAKLGDGAFFAQLNEAREGESGGWGALEAPWDARRFEEALRAPPVPETDKNFVPSEPRRQLLGALIKSFFTSYSTVQHAEGEAYISLDAGLSVVSHHAHGLGYEAVILFLDELILWLVGHAGDLKFVHQEKQKLVKLVEAQSADRPVPIVSFIARQSDIRKLIGENVPGAEKLNFSDAIDHLGGRFEMITLEDRNLPEIASRRLLVPKSEGARKELDLAFEETAKVVRDETMNALLTTKYDRGVFRKVYPFSPALVDTLVGVSSVLQRERTALKVMLQLLVDQRETLKLGDIVPVGDLFDVIAHGDEAFSEDMAVHFGNAKKLYHEKLLPLLEKQHDARREEIEKLPHDEPRRIAFRNDDRLVKTLLLAALVPGVESLKSLTASRLAALNHGTIRTPIPGREGQEVVRRCRAWSAVVGEIKVAGDGTNPTITVQLSGVDTESILLKAAREDNTGNRRRLVRQMLFRELGLEDRDEIFLMHDFSWRNTARMCEVVYGNVRELPDASLADPGGYWRLIIDFPFDEQRRTPLDDVHRLEAFQSSHPGGSKCLVWMPAFLSRDAQADLGKLVVLEHVLTGERYDGYAGHLSPQDRVSAKALLETQRDALRTRILFHLEAAYGLSSSPESAASIDTSHDFRDHFLSTCPGFEPRRPAAPGFAAAMLDLLGHALEHEFPAHPRFGEEMKASNLKKVHDVVQAAARSEDGRIEPEKQFRTLLRGIANPLLLGEMHETAFVLGRHWKEHFTQEMALAGGTPTVKQLREWMDKPRPMGLPSGAQNLAILTFAEQTDHEFYRHGVPYEPTLSDLPNDLELRKPALPDVQDWQTVIRRVGSIFGFEVSPLLNVANVRELESKVKAAAPIAREHVRKLCRALDARLGPNRGASKRLRTAKATLALVEAVAQADPKDLVSLLLKTEVATTEKAMGECFKHAEDFAARLEATSWEIFEAVGQLTGERRAAGEEIAAEVRRALEEDEHVVPLGTTLQRAQARAVRVLSEGAAAPVEPSRTTQPPRAPSPMAAASPSIQGVEDGLDLHGVRKLLDDLGKHEGHGQVVRFKVSWWLEDGGKEKR